MTAITELNVGDSVRLVDNESIGMYSTATIHRFKGKKVELTCGGEVHTVSSDTKVIIPMR